MSESLRRLHAILTDTMQPACQPSKLKRFRRPRQRKGCHLLKLPGELRNRIYELVIVEKGRLKITAKGPGQPALLRTCRQIRREAGTIYYGSNDFSLRIEAYNGAKFAPLLSQVIKLVPLPIAERFMRNVTFRFDGQRSWENVVRRHPIFVTWNNLTNSAIGGMDQGLP